MRCSTAKFHRVSLDATEQVATGLPHTRCDYPYISKQVATMNHHNEFIGGFAFLFLIKIEEACKNLFCRQTVGQPNQYVS